MAEAYDVTDNHETSEDRRAKLSSQGVSLVEQGFAVVPIELGDKRPKLTAWQTRTFSREEVVAIAMGKVLVGYKVGGWGILAGRKLSDGKHVYFLDVDVLHEGASKECLDHLTAKWGVDVCYRVGRAPKFTVPFTLVEGGVKLGRSSEFAIGDLKCQVELLGAGRQCVATGIHPNTGREYEWHNCSVATIATSNVPHVDSVADLNVLVNELDDIIVKHGGQVKVSSKRHSFNNVATYRPPLAAFTIDHAQEMLEVLHQHYPAYVDSYDKWLEVGMALHHNFEGNALAMVHWDAWSTKGAEFTAGACEKKWASFDSGAPNAVTIRSLLSLVGVREWWHDIVTGGALVRQRNPRGNPANHIENLEALCDDLGVIPALCAIRKEAAYGGEFCVDKTTSHMGETVRSALEGRASVLGWPAQLVNTHMGALTHRNEYDAVKGFLKELPPYDGKHDHIGFVADMLSGDRTWAYAAIQRFAIGAVAGGMNFEENPNIRARPKLEDVLVLFGPQGYRKTDLVKMLLPAEMRQYFKTGVNLALDKVDSIRQATSAWICELGELDATFRKSDISQLKAFLSKEADEYRLPYDRDASKFPRRTIFIGSVNEREFLRDMTGNRRYIPVEVSKVMALPAEFDPIQFWAQALKLYRDGQPWWIDEKSPVAELRNKVAASYTELRYQDQIYDTFDFDLDRDNTRYYTSTVLAEMLGIRTPTGPKEVGGSMSWLAKHRPDKVYKVQRGYYLPPLKKTDTRSKLEE